MDQENQNSIASNITSLGGKSWTAYVPVVLLGLLLLGVLTPLASLLSIGVGVVVGICSLAVLLYQFLELKSYHLYFDDVGVWIYSGILPWKKGVAGVKWRDLDEATYTQSLGSWLFKSYSIRIGHRFTKSSEIVLSHMANGQNIVITINQHHQDLIRTSGLN
ncbi:hypothetical protein [Undibacterium fentianense]|uniref:PH domain-containing protein n=1 Tax=Undibacterium fentianense TaxID=2828728 RepID=A0A941IDB9_9BURK|nr:hypothetical protein [Undibacterium fentianense]MBR7799803.1 hypothetical protein [Undibacterium fentianense]